MLRGLSVCCCLVLLTVMSPQALQNPSSASDASQRLQQLFAAEWEWVMEQNPTWASVLGDRRRNTRWEDVS